MRKHIPTVVIFAALTVGITILAFFLKRGDKAIFSPVENKKPEVPYVVLAGAGDIGSAFGNGDEQTAKLLDTVFATGEAGLIFTAGDNVNEDPVSLKDYQQIFGSTWGKYLNLIRPTQGNHDSVDYYKYFNVQPYYSYDLGSWHIISLNSNLITTAQKEWLENDLKNNLGKCVLAYWHVPLYSTGMHGGWPAVLDFWKILAKYHADVVVNGHNHNYERFSQINGIREFVVGTGGRGTYMFGDPQAVNEEVRDDNTLGIIKFKLYSDKYSWEFIPVAGSSFTDSGETFCHKTL